MQSKGNLKIRSGFLSIVDITYRMRRGKVSIIALALSQLPPAELVA